MPRNTRTPPLRLTLKPSHTAAALDPEPLAHRRYACRLGPDFDRDTALERLGRGRYRAHAPRGWWAERGLNGGLLAALAVRAATLEVSDARRRPRSLTVHYLVPAAEGALDVTLATERSGTRATNCLIRFEQDGVAVGLALAVLAAAIPTKRTVAHAPPDAPPPAALEPHLSHFPRSPAMMANYEYRLAFGSPPFSGSPQLCAGVWVRTARPRRPDPISVAAFADAWTPMPFIALERPAPAPTLELTIHFRDHAWYGRAEPDAFVLAAFRTRLIAEGFFEEDGELWSEDGVLIAESCQLAMLLE